MENNIGLYKHNIETYEKIKKAYEEGNDVVGIVHATGTGKTYVALQLAYDNKDKKIVYIVPSYGVLEHVKKTIENNPNIDLERDFPNLEFRTYQSLVSLSREEIEKIDCELLILDEFHHIGAPVWGSRVNQIIETHPKMKIFGMTAYTVRDRGTIYERDMTNEEADEVFSEKIKSRYDLCDGMIDGIIPKPIYKTAYIRLEKMAEQIEEKVNKLDSLSKEYQEYIQIINDAKRRIHEAPGIPELIQKNIKKDGKYIYFCPPYVEDGSNDMETIINEAMKWFKQIPEIKEEDIVIYRTTSKMGKEGKENRDAFYNDETLSKEDASGKLRVMFAINQYNEGVHAPNIDGVIMGRGTTSDIVYFEQLGRALSVRGNTKVKYEEYEKYTIEELIEKCKAKDIKIQEPIIKEELIEKLLAPVVIDLANNYEFIKELENNLQDRIKEIQENKQYGTRIIKIGNASFDIEIENIDLFETLSQLRDKLCTSWDDWFELASSYYRHHGNLLIPERFKTINGVEYDEDGLKLGQWVNIQKSFYKNKKLKEGRLEKLNSIGFVLDAREQQWNEMYKLASSYYKHHGNLLIPNDFKTINGYEYDEDGLKLGQWINYQKSSYKNKKLKDGRLEKLNSIGFVPDTLEQQWNEMYELASSYYRHHGNLLIPDDFKTINGYEYDEDGLKLEQWVSIQKKSYKNKNLKDGRLEKLNSIGFVPDAREQQWNEMYKLASSYYRYHGNLLIPNDFKTINGYEYDEDGLTLGHWINYQKSSYKNKKLKDGRLEKLNSIGFISNPFEQQWNEMYELASSYYRHHGNLLIPDYFKTINGIDYVENGLKLGIWLGNQRMSYKNNELKEERLKKLNLIGFVLDPFEQQWNEMYKLASSYYRRYGNLEIPQRFKTIKGFDYDENGLPLGRWISRQREFYKNNKLKGERLKKLLLIGFVPSTKNNKQEITEICTRYNIDFDINKEILSNISSIVLISKIEYFRNMNISIVDEKGKLIDAFSMSSIDMKVKYGVSLEEIINEYYEKEKGIGI